jgi:DNA repair protein RecO (recombination protein O)
MPRGKVDAQPAFVLHSYPFRETSLIVEVFSRDYGRVSLMARGARRPRAAIRGLMMAFQPLELGWAGKGEVLTLMKAEWQGGIPLLSGHALLCGYYLNELLINLLPREDAHAVLFAHYSEMLCRLGVAKGKVAEADLRWFEKCLLQELGYGLTLTHDNRGHEVVPEQTYIYEIERGAVPMVQAQAMSSPASFVSLVPSIVVQGQTLLDLYSDNFSDPRSQAEAKLLMRGLIAHYLGGKQLQSRNIFKEIS